MRRGRMLKKNLVAKFCFHRILLFRLRVILIPNQSARGKGFSPRSGNNNNLFPKASRLLKANRLSRASPQAYLSTEKERGRKLKNELCGVSLCVYVRPVALEGVHPEDNEKFFISQKLFCVSPPPSALLGKNASERQDNF